MKYCDCEVTVVEEYVDKTTSVMKTIRGTIWVNFNVMYNFNSK